MDLFKISTATILVLWASLGVAKTRVAEGTLYAIESKKPLLKYKRMQSGNKVRSHFETLDGKVLVTEKIEYESGQFKRYEIIRIRTKEKGIVESNGKKVKFYYKNKDGSVDKRDEDLLPNTIINDQVDDFIRKYWELIEKGESAFARYVVPYRTETIGVKFFKDGEATCRDQPSVMIKMKPSSFIIAMMVDPIYLNFEKKPPHRICDFKGRVTPLQEVDGKMETLDAHTIYEKSYTIE